MIDKNFGKHTSLSNFVKCSVTDNGKNLIIIIFWLTHFQAKFFSLPKMFKPMSLVRIVKNHCPPSSTKV